MSKPVEAFGQRKELYQLFQNQANGYYAWFRVGADQRESKWFRTLDDALNWSSTNRNDHEQDLNQQ